MAIYNDAIFTNAGKQLIRNVLANEDTVIFTRIVIGKGTYTAAEKSQANLITKTSLKNPVQSYDINYSQIVNESYVRLGTLITNYDPDTTEALINTDMYMNEIGIMAKGSEDINDVLYGIVVCTGETGDYIPGYTGENPIDIMQDFSIYVNSQAEVTIVYPETAYARATDLADTQAELEDTEDLLDSAREIMEDNLAPAYDDQISYVAGDWCIYEHVLYRCSGVTTGDFDSTKWDVVPVGSELKTLKKSVSDGKAEVAGAITEMNVPTAADASFQTMADNIGEILDENPGVISAGTNARSLSDNTSDSFKIPIEFNVRTAGYHKSGNDPVGTRSGETEYIRLYNRGDKVTAEIQYDVMQPNRKLGEVAKTAGTITATVGTTSGTADTATLTPSFTIDTAGQHSSSVGTRNATTKTLSFSDSVSKAYISLKDGNTTIAHATKATGSVSSAVTTVAGTSDTASVTPTMTFSQGYIASKGTETAKTLTLANSGDNVILKDGGTTIAQIAKTVGKITATVGTTSNTGSASATLTPGFTVDTSGHHSSSKGTRTATAKTVTMTNNGANVDLKDGDTVIARVAKSTGSVSSSASFSSGTSTTVTANSAMSFTAGHIASKGTEGTATAYLRKSGNYVYLSSSSSGGTNYGRYSISTQTKSSYASSGGNVSVSPDSGKYLTGVTINKYRSQGALTEAFSGGSSYYVKRGADYFANAIYHTVNAANKIVSNSHPFYANEFGGSGYLNFYMGGDCTAGSVYVCISTDSSKTTANFGNSGAYTQIKSWGSGLFGYIVVPIRTSYTNGTEYAGKNWTVNSGGTVDENTAQYVSVMTSSDFSGQLFFYGISGRR